MFSLHFTSLCPATVARGVVSSPGSSKSRGQSSERLASSCTCKDLLPLSSSKLNGADPWQSVDLYQEMSTIMMFSHWICFHDNRHCSSNLHCSPHLHLPGAKCHSKSFCFFCQASPFFFLAPYRLSGLFIFITADGASFSLWSNLQINYYVFGLQYNTPALFFQYLWKMTDLLFRVFKLSDFCWPYDRLNKTMLSRTNKTSNGISV